VNNICVIGVGHRPLDERACEILLRADDILASNRLFEVFKGYKEFEEVREKVRVINKIDETLEFIRGNFEKRAVVLLASGDPLFFGIGRRVIDEFDKKRVEIFPDLSSMQVAFSKIKEPWDDVFLMSLHGGPDPEKRRRLPYEIDDIPTLLREHYKIAVLTDRENNPSEIARRALSAPERTLKIFVCEKLGYPDEKITSGAPEEIAGMSFPDPNVVILLDSAKAHKYRNAEEKIVLKDAGPVFGLTEGEIAHSRGLITKDEVRAASIHKLRLPKGGILWDIGAGSGSVSIEAARLFPESKVFAIERNEEQISHIKGNKQRFGTPNVAITCGEAPEALKDLPSPDGVFIGGSGGRLSGIIRLIKGRMPRGVVVLNAVMLETLNEAILHLENNGFETEISQISVSRSKVLNGHRQMAALNPVFVIRGEIK
jgi:precorrin-6Y C5,15-methyltransferase (decarboxylating)